jgi:hypothetical protein
VGEALAKLHAAGRIRSPWLPGMATDHHVRVLESQHDGCPGLVLVADDEGVGWVWPYDTRPPKPFGSDDDGPIGEPDTDDPGTVGCLLALLREASREPRTFIMFSASAAAWVVSFPSDLPYFESYVSDADAIRVALIALARAPRCHRETPPESPAGGGTG